MEVLLFIVIAEGDYMDKRILKISFSRGGSGSISPKICLPKSRLDLMGVNKDSREVELEFDDTKMELIIRKKK